MSMHHRATNCCAARSLASWNMDNVCLSSCIISAYILTYLYRDNTTYVRSYLRWSWLGRQKCEPLRVDLGIEYLVCIFHQIMFVDWPFAFLHITEESPKFAGRWTQFESEDSSSQWALTL
jgi:hypothetical protein